MVEFIVIFYDDFRANAPSCFVVFCSLKVYAPFLIVSSTKKKGYVT